MTKKILTNIFVLFMVFCLVFVFVGCNHTTAGIIPTPPVGGGDNNNDPNVGGNNNDPNKPLVARYNIYFYTDPQATQISTMTGIKAGESITAPDAPEYVRHNFLGWFTDYGTFNEPFVFDKMPDHDVVLYAKWESAINDNELQAYEDMLDETSENGHLYIHYLRFDNDPDAYAKMSLWIWPRKATGRTFNWEKDEFGNVIVDPIGGAVCDVDMTQFYTDAGNNETENLQFFVDGAYGAGYQPSYMKDVSKHFDPDIGFLIVYDESKNSGGHWTSDCGNQYFNIVEAVRDNGSIHIFATQNHVRNFVFKITDKEEIENPYENDDGTHVSLSDVNSSVDLSATKDPTNLFDTVSGVGYQIMVASFADSDGDGYGDIRGIIENIDYLESLNVDVLWLTPIQLSDSYHGYDIIDYCAVDPKFGTLEDYKELLRLCHSKGMKVIMDLVLNHTSINNVWFQKSAQMKVEDGIDYRSFYHWRNHEKEDLSQSWYKYSEYSYSYYAKFASGMPELNYDYQPTRDAILGVAEFWMTLLGESEGVDGFRIDAVKHIYMLDEVTPKSTDVVINDFDKATNTDYSSNVTKNLNFFCWLIDGVKAINPNAYMVGENFDGHAYNVAPYYKAFDGMLDFYLYYNLAKLATNNEWASGIAGENSTGKDAEINGVNTTKLYSDKWNLNSILNTNKKYGNNTLDSIFTSNHDVPRLINHVAGTMSGSDLVAGTLSSSNSADAQKRALTVISAVMTLPGIGWIYYGDELGMSSNYDPGESKTSPHVDRQYRQPFKWTTNADGSKYITNFSISGDKTYYVKWDSYNATLAGAKEQKAQSNSFLNQVMKWTKLKSEDPVIRYGDYGYKKFGSNGDMMGFTRSYNGKTYWVVVNFGKSEYQNAQSQFGSGAKLICSSNGSSLNYIAPGGTVVVQIK